MANTDNAVDILQFLIEKQGLKPKTIDQTYDLMKLIGFVVAQMALLEVVASASAKDRDRVRAAKTLLTGTEDPNSVAERLRRSPFASLTAKELEAMIQRVKAGEDTIQSFLHKLEEPTEEATDARTTSVK